MVARQWNRRAAEIQRVALLVHDHLDDIRIAKFLQRRNRMCCRAHAGVCPLVQQIGHGMHQQGIDHRLITLHVDDHMAVIEAQQVASLGQAVAARGMVGTGQYRLDAVGGTGVDDRVVVGGHHHAYRTRSGRRGDALCHAHHHGYAGNGGQRLVGQACRGQPGRDQDGECHRMATGSAILRMAPQRASIVWRHNCAAREACGTDR